VELWDLLVNNPDLPDPITYYDEILWAGKASMHCQILYLDNNNFHCSERNFIIQGKAMTLKEQRIEQMKNRIAESKRALGGSNQVGPLVVIFFGIGLFWASVMGFGVGFFGMGVITVLLAIVWAYSKSRNATQLKKEIYEYEWDLYNIEKDLEKGTKTTL
jgi:Flp pilus assembly protein TadB